MVTYPRTRVINSENKYKIVKKKIMFDMNNNNSTKITSNNKKCLGSLCELVLPSYIGLTTK